MYNSNLPIEKKNILNCENSPDGLPIDDRLQTDIFIRSKFCEPSHESPTITTPCNLIGNYKQTHAFFHKRELHENKSRLKRVKSAIFIIFCTSL